MKQFTSTLSSNWSSLFNNIAPQSFMSARETFTKTGNRFRKPNFKFSRNIILIILGVVVIGGIIFIARSGNTGTTQLSSSSKPIPPTIKETQEINRVFNFPIRNADGKVVNMLKLEILSANLQDEILIKGQRAKAVEGRVFLILNLKITNNYEQGIQINSRDYVRLIVDGKKTELIAADIHNDPVDVQAISTKSTRIGFPIDDTDKSLELQVGEINGKKQTIKIDFSKK